MFEARAPTQQIEPIELAVALAGPTPPLVIDTRTLTDRDRFGVISGSIHAPRTALERHFDPPNGYQHPAIASFDRPMVIVCNGGHSSSLAVALLGFSHVADLVGGHHGWVAERLTVVEPDHAHLDL